MRKNTQSTPSLPLFDPPDVEIWKPLICKIGRFLEFPDYEVSNLGNVRRTTPKCGATVGKILKPVLVNGYHRVSLHAGDEMVLCLVHRIVACTFIGIPPANSQVNHINGCKTDNRAVNLEHCTAQQNTLHAIDHGLNTNQGEKHGNAKLTLNEVIEIRRLLAEEVLTGKEIASRFHVSRSTISCIRRGVLWKRLGDLPAPRVAR